MAQTTKRNQVRVLGERHTAVVASALAALNGGKLTADERQEAADLLLALSHLLAGDGAVQESVVYLLKNAADSIRLARVQAAAQ